MTTFCGLFHNFVEIDLVIVVIESHDICLTSVCSHVHSLLDVSGAEFSSHVHHVGTTTSSNNGHDLLGRKDILVCNEIFSIDDFLGCSF